MLPYFLLFLGFSFIFNSNSFSEASIELNSVSPSFSIDYKNDQFLLDGKPFRYISGSIHYFRIHPSQWRDRLQRVRALGFNAIQYYIPWNFHEIYEGQYNFSGWQNFTEFSLIAYEMGMYSLIRLGPYICGEWENGGLPWWLLNKNITTMRSSEERFKSAVQKWFSVLLPEIKPLLRHNNGPVLMVQIENEYGSYRECDRSYTAWLRDLTRSYLGKNTVIYTTDGNSENLLNCGTTAGTLATIDFGPSSRTNINASFDMVKKFLPYADGNSENLLNCGTTAGTLATIDFGPSSRTSINASFNMVKKFLPYGHGPLVNSEFYPGWLVLWGEKTAHIPSLNQILESAEYMYKLGANINFYMIHGGTNFGFWNGAETNAPCITSYDYFAPISEAGDITAKYLAIRLWIKGIPGWKTQPLSVPKNNPKTSFGTVTLQPVNDLSRPPKKSGCISSKSPMSFEQLNQPFGFVLYTKRMTSCGKRLEIKQLKDFGYVYLNSKYLGTFMHSYYGKIKNSVDLDGCNPGDMLIILVENQGRQTYETINDSKVNTSKNSKFTTEVTMDGKTLENWIHCKLDITDDFENVSSSRLQSAGKHGVYSGVFEINTPTDTFLNTTGWGKGVAIVNGKNVGRYWSTEGPQKYKSTTLPLPDFLMRILIVLFEY
ncbi:glycosyl hydrolase family 35 [Dictyocaulus viviparus]|uniref:Glycosyl hydrolase family 35 n=1 Tax=Dictyocaulus viviparus TaxID=29172 RepID=A0A0D8Y8M0_DICVI|nr:glycosyl hydrolase family 35 [Dictyocaulus viviparus]